MNIRGFLFDVYTRLFDRETVNNLSDIKDVLIKGNIVSQNLRLDRLIKYATQNVPFYQQYVGRNFVDFPVINKTIIRSNFTRFTSICSESTKFYSVTTSGSTGTPFRVYHDRMKRKRHNADNIFFMQLSGYELGTSLYYLRVWNKIARHNILHTYITNIRQIEISDLSDERMEKLIQMFNHKEKKTILAFASTYEYLYLYLKKNKISKVGKNVQALISMSEHLSENVRKELSIIFGVPVISRYSNMENGFIAQQLVDKDYYIVNNASYKVELLDINKDTPVGLNEVGRIVVTDLYNYAMPLIRYDTGDLGVFKIADVEGKKQVVLSSIEGRVVDMIFRTDGSLVSPHIITNTMWAYEELKQWQFIQIEKCKYKFIMNGKLSDSKRNELEKTLQSYLGKDAEFYFENVDEIPVLSSGKRKKIVNLMG